MKINLFIFILIFSNTLIAASRNRLFTSASSGIGENSYEIKSGINYFEMVSHFDTDGSILLKNDGDVYNSLEGTLDYVYGISDQLEFMGGLRMRQNIYKSLVSDASNSGLESLYGGVRYSMLVKSKNNLRYSLELKYRQTPYSNTSYEATAAPTDEIVLGDSGNEINFGLNVTYENTINNFIFLHVAYNRPPNDLSPEIEYRLESFYPYTNWGFSLGLKGISSFGADSYSGQAESKPSQATGVTYLFNSINRSYMAPFISFERAFTNWKMSVEYSQLASGTSTDQGHRFMSAITYRKTGVTKEKRKISKFKEYVVEASVVKTSPRSNFVKIDKGIAQDVEKGLHFDIFKADYFGGNILVATGIVFEVGSDWAIIKLKARYRQMRILPGFVARGY